MNKKVGGELNMNKKKIIGICVVIFVIVFVAICIAIVQFSKKDLIFLEQVRLYELIGLILPMHNTHIELEPKLNPL